MKIKSRAGWSICCGKGWLLLCTVLGLLAGAGWTADILAADPPDHPRWTTSAADGARAWTPYQDRYALVVMGGHVSGPPYYQWYWGDTYGTYRQLIDHGFSAANIYFLSYGDSVATHPGVVDGLSTTQGIRDAYAWARTHCDAEDLLYIYWVDHGSPTDFETYDGVITHGELGALTGAITARCVAGAYNPCYSGAIIDDVSRPGVFTTTSQDATHTNSYGWAGAWRTGLGGGAVGDPSDIDGDGVVSFTEAYLWVCPRSQAAGEHPMLDDNGDTIGHECTAPGFDPDDPSLDGYFGTQHSLDGWRSGPQTVQLIAYWPFDEGSGTAVGDSSGHGNDGVNSGGEWIEGVFGGALDLRGTDIVHSIPGSYDDPINNAFTIAAWVRWQGPNEYGRGSCIFDGRSANSGMFFGVDPAGRFYLNCYRPGGAGQGIVSARSAPVGQWTHVAAVFNGDQQAFRIYVDGTFDAEAVTVAPYYPASLTAAIGNNRWAPGDGQWSPLNGAVDELRLYDGVLPDEQILQLTGLLAWWCFDEGAGNTIGDMSGRGMDGVGSGCQWVPGVWDTALDICGTDIVRSIPATYDDPITDAFTISGWVLWHGPNEYARSSSIFDGRSADAGMFAGITPEGHICLNVYRSGGVGQGVVGTGTVPVGSWIHFAVTFDAAHQMMRSYLGGHLDGEAPAAFPYTPSYLTAAVGNNRWAPGDGQWAPLNGVVEDLRIVRRAISPEEVAADVPENRVPGGREVILSALSRPNPFHEGTSLRFTLSASATVRVDLFRVDGRRVATLHQGILVPGPHLLWWNGFGEGGRRVPPGIYLARVQAGQERRVLRLCLLD